MSTQNNCQIHSFIQDGFAERSVHSDTVWLFSPGFIDSFFIWIQVLCNCFTMSCWHFCRSHFYGWIKLHPFYAWYVKLVKHFTRINNIKGCFLCHNRDSNWLTSQSESLEFYCERETEMAKPMKNRTNKIFNLRARTLSTHFSSGCNSVALVLFVCAMKRRVAVLQSSCAVWSCVSTRAHSLNGLVTRWSIRHRTQVNATYSDTLRKTALLTYYLICFIGEKRRARIKNEAK